MRRRWQSAWSRCEQAVATPAGTRAGDSRDSPITGSASVARRRQFGKARDGQVSAGAQVERNHGHRCLRVLSEVHGRRSMTPSGCRRARRQSRPAGRPARRCIVRAQADSAAPGPRPRRAEIRFADDELPREGNAQDQVKIAPRDDGEAGHTGCGEGCDSSSGRGRLRVVENFHVATGMAASSIPCRPSPCAHRAAEPPRTQHLDAEARATSKTNCGRHQHARLTITTDETKNSAP